MILRVTDIQRGMSRHGLGQGSGEQDLGQLGETGQRVAAPGRDELDADLHTS